MPEFASALRWHWKDRRVTLPALIRLPITTGTALAPLVVGLPTHYGLVSVAFFLPMVFGVIGAMTLGENIRWLRPRNRLLWVCRGLTTVSVDFVCLIGLFITIDGQHERVGILAGAMLAAAAGMVVACFAEDFAWLAAALVGFSCLIALDRPVVLYLPVGAALVAYGAALVVFSIAGPAPGLGRVRRRPRWTGSGGSGPAVRSRDGHGGGKAPREHDPDERQREHEEQRLPQ